MFTANKLVRLAKEIEKQIELERKILLRRYILDFVIHESARLAHQEERQTSNLQATGSRPVSRSNQ